VYGYNFFIFHALHIYLRDESLKKHIQFLEQQGIAGVNRHGVLFCKTETTATLGDDGAINRSVISYSFFSDPTYSFVFQRSCYSLLCVESIV
jgi:hypothetical protein